MIEKTILEEVLNREMLDKPDHLFLMVCDSDAMEPMILRGELILCAKDEDIEQGDVGLVAWGGKWLVRGILYGKDDLLSLRATNAAYRDIELRKDDEDYLVVGRVLAVWGSLRRVGSVL